MVLLPRSPAASTAHSRDTGGTPHPQPTTRSLAPSEATAPPGRVWTSASWEARPWHQRATWLKLGHVLVEIRIQRRPPFELDVFEIKNLCAPKDTTQKMKPTPRMGENICRPWYPIRLLYLEHVHFYSSARRADTPVKMGRRSGDTLLQSSQPHGQPAHEKMSGAVRPQEKREPQPRDPTSHPPGRLQFGTTDSPGVARRWGTGTPLHCWGEGNGATSLENRPQFLKNGHPKSPSNSTPRDRPTRTKHRRPHKPVLQRSEQHSSRSRSSRTLRPLTPTKPQHGSVLPLRGAEPQGHASVKDLPASHPPRHPAPRRHSLPLG